ncbi:uncharacterized protein KQ657_002106 [Scheffersomyces spartinae]|uniref:Uncharacterized protein n=1 Tax=Scheffersomyces spartinae TaxID=45513 RepID=A0A9P8AKD2_9ASCO|nr:uncharacterized protein KQ657_002106 [Scheffersomyces spartinae]KAG7195723.1 hypothetical protein KQ657_002106 [Scheffersomyces spartinae]
MATPLLQTDEEEEVINYVQHRRASIASTGITRIPLGMVRHDPDTVSTYGSLRPTLSNKRYDIQSVLSHHSELAPEPDTQMIIEMWVLFKYSLPLIVTFLLQYSLNVASVFSVGRLGSAELAAVSLSTMTANITGYSIIQGVCTCLDTLCAQAYGRKDYNTVGLYLVRCTILLFIVYVFVFILWMFGSEPILTLLIESNDPKIVKLASDYLKVLSFGVPGFIVFENCKHYLQCIGIFHAPTYVLFVCAPLNIVLNYILVWNNTIGIGFLGAPLAVVITNWVMCFSLCGYIWFVDGKQCLPRDSSGKILVFNKAYLQNWPRMIELAVPGVLQVLAEWLAFEIITFVASKFGTEYLAAQSIVSTTSVLLYQIPFALSISISTRVAWYIGAAAKKSVMTTTKAALYLSLLLGLNNCWILWRFRYWLASLYTNDPEVIKLAAPVIIIAAIYQINDFVSCCTGGILRGQARQKIGGYLNLVGYYLIALPISITLAIHFNMKLMGLWIGMIIALLIVSISQLAFVLTSDWDQVISQCIADGIQEDINIETVSNRPSMSSKMTHV